MTMHKIKGKNLSEETLVEACEKFGISFEKKFEPISIHGGCFTVGVERREVIISPHHSNCRQLPSDIQQTIAALQSASNFIETET